MMQNRPNQQQMLVWIDMISFTLCETALYLDTHPEDKEAMEYYNHFLKMRREALAEYSSRFTPLTLDEVNCEEDYWKWVKDKWPWERGDC